MQELRYGNNDVTVIQEPVSQLYRGTKGLLDQWSVPPYAGIWHWNSPGVRSYSGSLAFPRPRAITGLSKRLRGTENVGMMPAIAEVACMGIASFPDRPCPAGIDIIWRFYPAVNENSYLKGGGATKNKYVWAFRIVGKECGRDSSGTFYCNCGECSPFRVDIGKGGKYCGDDRCDGRYDGKEHIDYFPPFGPSGS